MNGLIKQNQLFQFYYLFLTKYQPDWKIDLGTVFLTTYTHV